MSAETKNIKRGLRLMLLGEFADKGKINLGISDLHTLYAGLVSTSVLTTLMEELMSEGDFIFDGFYIRVRAKDTGRPLETPSIARMLRDFRNLFDPKSKIKVKKSKQDFAVLRALSLKHGWETIYDKYDTFKQFVLGGGQRGNDSTVGIAEFKRVCFPQSRRK